MDFFEVAEQKACDYFACLGFDAVLMPPGRDGGIDITDRTGSLAVQVKATQSPVGAPVIQQLVGASRQVGASIPACVSMNGYTQDAELAAESLGVALFTMNLKGQMSPVNAAAASLGQPTYPQPPADPVDLAANRALEDLRNGSGADEIERTLLRLVTDHGSTVAMRNLGTLYFERTDFPTAYGWFQRAVDTGDPESAYFLAHVSEQLGHLELAEQWYLKAIELGDTMSAKFLGELLRDKCDRPDDALRWLTLAHQQGYGSCDDIARWLWRIGRKAEALVWAEQASRQDGHGDAHYLEADSLLNEIRGELDVEENERALVRLAVFEKSTFAMRNLGLLHEERDDLGKAERWFREAVELGDRDSAYQMATMEETRENYTAAEEWYKKAIALGDTDSLSELGRMLRDKCDRPADALDWLTLAYQKDKGSANDIAIALWKSGREEEAVVWGERASEEGRYGPWKEIGCYLLWRAHDYPRAKSFLHQAFREHRDSGDRGGSSLIAELLSVACKEMGDPSADYWSREAQRLSRYR